MKLQSFTSERLQAFVEWLLSRCVGDGPRPPRAPFLLGEGERRLIRETADSIGRELFGPSWADEGGRLVLRLVLDLCSGASCADQRPASDAPPERCSSPGESPRRPVEIGYLCVGGPLQLECPVPGSLRGTDRGARPGEVPLARRAATEKEAE